MCVCVSSGGFRGVSLVSVETPFSAACVRVASPTERADCSAHGSAVSVIHIEIDPEGIAIAITSRLHQKRSQKV